MQSFPRFSSAFGKVFLIAAIGSAGPLSFAAVNFIAKLLPASQPVSDAGAAPKSTDVSGPPSGKTRPVSVDQPSPATAGSSQPTVAPTPTASSSSEPYSRRNYKLGATLSDFKKMPHPDPDAWPNAYPVCSDTLTAPTGTPLGRLDDLQEYLWKELGVIKCQFFYETPDREAISAGLYLDSVSPFENDFYFFPKSDGAEPILFMISSPFPSGRFDEVASAFEQKFGKPKLREDVPVQNKIGNVFENTQIMYSNGTSMIVLRRFGENLDRSSLMYELNETFDHVTSLEKKRTSRGL